jgi:hypothetical protein
MTPPAFLLALFYNSASLADGPITLGVTLLERTAATEFALSLPFIQSCRQRTSLQPKRAGADNGAYTGLLPSWRIHRHSDGLRSNGRTKNAW